MTYKLIVREMPPDLWLSVWGSVYEEAPGFIRSVSACDTHISMLVERDCYGFVMHFCWMKGWLCIWQMFCNLLGCAESCNKSEHGFGYHETLISLSDLLQCTDINRVWARTPPDPSIEGSIEGGLGLAGGSPLRNTIADNVTCWNVAMSNEHELLVWHSMLTMHRSQFLVTWWVIIFHCCKQSSVWQDNHHLEIL